MARGRPRSEEPGPYVRGGIEGAPALAAGVLRQAIHDARSPTQHIAQEAQHFLADDEALTFWCDLAGLEVTLLRWHLDRQRH
jgi:hypothetical protein